ncbi:MAG: hypothetical protein K2J73_03930 [Oscillospiraceae bacterium]|nr:hypothetical protein [Oscillospiraceae bacterium]
MTNQKALKRCAAVLLAIEILFCVIYLLGVTGIGILWSGNIWETIPELIELSQC